MTDGLLKPIAHAWRDLLPADKLFINRKRNSWDYIRNLKFLPQYLRSTHHTTNRSQTTIHIFGSKKSSYECSQQTDGIGYNPVKLQLQNGVPTIEKFRPWRRIVKINSQVQQRTSERYSDRLPSI